MVSGSVLQGDQQKTGTSHLTISKNLSVMHNLVFHQPKGVVNH